MKLFAVFFVFGVLVVLSLPELLSWPLLTVLLITVTLTVVLVRKRLQSRKLAHDAAYWTPLAFLFGAVICWQVVKTELTHKLKPGLHGTDVELVVRIEGVPVHGEGWSRFRCLVIDTVDAPSTFTARRLQVTWYRHDNVLAAGDTWRLRLRVKPPRGLMNPGGFDYALWLFEQRVHALAYVRAAPVNERLNSHPALMSELRQNVRDRLVEHTAGREHGGLMQALLVGMRSDVPDSLWTLLRRTGTSHLLAISGLHIGLAATWGYLLGTLVVRVLSFAGIRLNRIDIGGLFALIVASGYSVLAGWTIPTRRALFMLLLYLMFVLMRRHSLKTTPLFTALFLLVLLDPLSVLSPGFWLSFGAVGSLIYLTVGRVQTRGGRGARVLQVLQVHTALAVLLFPLTALFFGQASVISPIANLVAVPVMSLVVVPLLLLWLLVGLYSDVLAVALLWLVDKFLLLLMALLQPLSELAVAAVALRDVDTLWLFAALLGVLMLMLPRCRERWLGLPLLLPYIWLQFTPVYFDELVVDVLDVGQGLSVVVRYQDKTLLYDTGGKLTPTLTMTEAVVTPFLSSQGVRRLDHVVISHTDTDHAAGFAALAERWPVGRWWLPAELAQHPDEVCRAGESWRWGELQMDLLYPFAGGGSGHLRLAGSDNNHSCVLRIRYGKTTVLLPGDLEKKAERRLLRHLFQQHAAQRSAQEQVTMPWSEILRRRHLEEQLPVSLLLAAHHGSKTSSAPSWLDYFRPERVVYAVGYRNRFGFPHETVQMRYKVRDTIAYRTDHDGAVRFRFGREGLLAEPERYRLSAKRVWHTSTLPGF
ncbi:MAG: DNA internalization-related competence protein ComEC/Rec2 [Gammaproteobacteria bacterium]|nr:DNA internalization-related competence protein ComEC/Rec2 [Gammaproteobacteria bacterium]